MRLSKTLLFAAAGALTLPAVSTAELINQTSFYYGRFYTPTPEAYQYYSQFAESNEVSVVSPTYGLEIRPEGANGPVTLNNLTGNALLVLDKGMELILNSEYSSTFNGAFFGEGNITKNGTGSLQYNGFSSLSAGGTLLSDSFKLNWAGDTRPGYGYFRGATNLAEYYAMDTGYLNIAERDPRSDLWTFYPPDSVYSRSFYTGTLIVKNSGGLNAIVAHVTADPTVVVVRTGAFMGLLQLGNEPYAKILTRTGLYPIDFTREQIDATAIREGRQKPLEQIYYTGSLLEDTYSTIRAESLSSADDSMAFGGLSGTVTINAGELDVKGYLSHWREFPGAPSVDGDIRSDWNYDAIQLGVANPKMVGVSNIVMNGNARITFRNSELNITAVEMDWQNRRDTPRDPDPHAPNEIRLNYAHNLQTGEPAGTVTRTVWEVEKVVATAPDPITGEERVVIVSGYPVYKDEKVKVTTEIPVYSNDQYQTELEVGLQDQDGDAFRIITHIDQHYAGSIGVISGVGRFFKTGAGDFSILNKSTLDGPVFLAGGQTILDPKTPSGTTGTEILAGVSSVNLVGDDGMRGTRISPLIKAPDSPLAGIAAPLQEFTMGYAPKQEEGSSWEIWVNEDGTEKSVYTENFAQLVLRSDQTIRNLQALFAESSGPAATDDLKTVESAIQSAQKDNPVEVYIAGQGKGTNIQIDSYTLTVLQEKDGVYRGNLNLNWNAKALGGDVNEEVQKVATLSLPGISDTYTKREAMKKSVVVAYQSIEKARALLDLKIKNSDGSLHYDETLAKLDALMQSNPFGEQSVSLGDMNPDDVNRVTLVNLSEVRVNEINSVVDLTRQLLSLSRDDYALFALGEEPANVKNLYTYFLDTAGTNNALETWFGGDLPAGESREALCNKIIKDIFGVEKGATDIERAKAILADGAKLAGEKTEEGSALRYGNILEALEAGNMQRVKQLFAATGTFEKKGSATLALLVASAKIENLIVSEGELLANVQALGYSEVTIKDGVLKILQNDTGTLHASIKSPKDEKGNPRTDGVLIFTTRGYVTNDSGQQMLVGEDNSGTALIRQRQDDFYGTVIIEEGVTVQLSAQTDSEGNGTLESLNDSFSKISAMILRGGESQRRTTLVMNGTDQRIRNLSGDSCGRLLLGSGILVVDQELDQVFGGKISGQGSVVKEGDGTFRLDGTNDFYGVAIVSAGALDLRAQNSLERASALIIKTDASVVTGDMAQRVGALFGEKDALLNIGSGGFTVGISDVQYESLVAEDKAGTTGLLNMNYLATLTDELKTAGGVNDRLLYGSSQSSRATDGTTVGFLLSPLVGMKNAEDMAYSGSIKGTGDLIKTGKERLTLDGKSPEFTGKTILQQGILRINADSVNGSEVQINTPALDAKNYFEINADAGVAPSRIANITGSGDLHKVGKGEAELQGDVSYKGGTIVEEGSLVVTGHVDGLNNSREIQIRDAGVIVFNSMTAAAYNGNITGTGGVEKRGAGDVVLNGTLSYGHEKTPVADGKTLYSFPDALPAGTTFKDGVIFFPEGTKLDYDGTVLLPDGQKYVPQNLEDVRRVESNDAYAYTVTARATGFLVKKKEGGGEKLIALAPEVVAAPANSELRASGVVVAPNGDRLNTYGGIISRGDDWVTVWRDGVEVSEEVSYFFDPEAWLVEKKSVNDFADKENIDPSKVEDGYVDWLSQEKRIVVMETDGSLSLRTSGATVVEGGSLEIHNLPAADDSAGEFEIRAGARLTLRVDEAETLFNNLRGEGVFKKTGALDLHLDRAQNDFGGRFELGEGAVYFGAENVLANARDVYLGSNTELTLTGDGATRQSFHYILGEESSVINVNGAELTLNVEANEGEERIYRGLLLGGGSLEKTGAGTLILWRPTGAQNNELDSIHVAKGVLQAAPVALGDAEIDLNAGTELRFYTETTDRQQDYLGALTGTGVVGKIGGGTVYLKGDAPLGDECEKVEFHVHEGRLIVDGSRVGDEVVPSVRIKNNATFQLNLIPAEDDSSRYLALGKNMVTDFAPGDHGNFAISGPAGTTLTVNGTPLGYTGKTELIGGLELYFDGASFQDYHAQLVGGLSGVKIINETTGEIEAPIVHLGGALAVELVQNLEGVFEGDFMGYASGAKNLEKTNYGGGSGLIIKEGTEGSKKLVYRGSDGRGILPEGAVGEINAGRDVNGRGVGNVTIDGGQFQVGVENIHTIDIANGGVLFVENNIDREWLYTGYITNAGGGEFSVKSVSASGNAVVWDGSSFAYLGGGKMAAFGVESGSVARLSINGGEDILNVFPAKTLYTNGILEVETGSSATLGATITGEGGFRKTGDGALSINAVQQYAGATEVNNGVLKGNFEVQGDLVVNTDGTLAPGNSIGTVVTNKDLVLSGGVLEVEIDAIDPENMKNDLFLVGGKVILNGGTIRVQSMNIEGGAETARGNIARGSKFTIAKSTTEGVPLQVEYVDMPDVKTPDSNEHFILLTPNSGKGTAYAGIANEGLTLLVGQKELSRVPGYKAHEGLDSFHAALDSVATLRVPPFSDSDITDNFVAWYDAQAGALDALSHLSAEDARKNFAEAVKALTGGLPSRLPTGSSPALKQTYEWLVAAYEIGAFLNTASESALRPLVNNLSPLGYSSLVAMPATVASNNVDQLRARIEQRRYDRSLFISDHQWQAYLIGAGSLFKSGDGADSATYDFNTQGGIVGADVLAFDNRGVLGGAVEYTNGSSTLDDGGGKIKLNAVRATGYFSYQLGDWFYVDAGAGGGYMSYDAKRNTATGANDASPEGWQAGGFALVGSVFRVHREVNFTPYAGFEYNHYEVFGFTEKGSRSRLKVDDFGFDSLRAKVGGGLAWVSGGYDWNWKIGVDAAFAHELLDTESDISSRFALDPFGLTNSTTRSKTLSRNVLQLAPAATLNLTEQTSVFASYRWEYGFDGEVRHNLNAGIRFRF